MTPFYPAMRVKRTRGHDPHVSASRRRRRIFEGSSVVWKNHAVALGSVWLRNFWSKKMELRGWDHWRKKTLSIKIHITTKRNWRNGSRGNFILAVPLGGKIHGVASFPKKRSTSGTFGEKEEACSLSDAIRTIGRGLRMHSDRCLLSDDGKLRQRTWYRFPSGNGP